MKVSNKVLATMGLNLLALTSGLFAQTSNGVNGYQPAAEKNDAATVNAATLQSIESSWLQVSHVCKAKGFNADPSSLALQQQSEKVSAVYHSFDMVGV